MRNRIDIDPQHSLAIVQEIGERLRAFLKGESELPRRPERANRSAPRIGRAVATNHSGC
jgi:hypothetical protein